MNNLYLLLFLFLFSSCLDESSKTFKSGVAMNDSINDQSQVRLNFRIKTEADDQHSSLRFLNHLIKSDFSQLPPSWPETSLENLTEGFKFLHRRPSLIVDSLRYVSQPTYAKISLFKSEYSVIEFIVNRLVTELTWKNGREQNVFMKKSNLDQWDLWIDGEHLIWRPERSEMCYNNLCEVMTYDHQ